MPRENSFSDGDSGRSLTPELEENIRPSSPTYGNGDSNSKAGDHIEPPKSPISLKSQKTHRSRQPVTFAPGRSSTLPPGARFRATVRKVIAMHRTSTVISNRGIGAEPGIDPRRASAAINYGHIRQECVIEMSDYSGVRSSFGRMTNKEFVDLMQDEGASAKEKWVKVRWINIGGISWDVISAVALKYDLHPLALEDVLNQRGHSRSKADYYQRHLFLRILCHTLGDENDTSAASVVSHLPGPHRQNVTDLPRSMSPTGMNYDDMGRHKDTDLEMGEIDDEKMMYDSVSSTRKGTAKSTTRRRRRPFFAGRSDDATETASARLLRLSDNEKEARDKRARDMITVERLKKGARVNVKVAPMFIFLLRDGTVISIHPDNNLEFTAPIIARLRSRDTLLRTSADPSMLVQGLLDLIVDQALEVIDQYHGKILALEHEILLKPKMKTVRFLHIISGDLMQHKRTLEPIKTIVYGLRRYDVDRVAALYDTNGADKGVKIEGFMSHKSKIYLADVFDHMEYILGNLDMFAGIAQNLIDYTFNMVSYEMNEVMRRLTLATIIFLPLTLLTGYFGMNFESMWSVQQHSDALFWYIAAPVMVVVIFLFLWKDVQRMVHYFQKKVIVKDVAKNYKFD